MTTLAGFQHPSFFESWLENAIASDTLHAALINAAIAPESQSVAAIIANEAANTHGYARQSISTSGFSITYSNANNRAEYSDLVCNFAASGGDIAFQGAILLIGGSATYGNTSGAIMACVQWPTPQTIPDGSPPLTVRFQLQNPIAVYNTTGVNPAF
jgi:hypothetical protein